MDETFERLRALDGKRVWATLLRAKDQFGPEVYRSGVFRLFDTRAGEPPMTRILDAEDLPVVTFLGTDTLSVVGGALRAELRPSFRIDVSDARPSVTPAGGLMSYDHVARELVAELEAGFRAALRVRPDPDPDASLRARYNIPAIEEGPLSDFSVRFAVGHNSATLRPESDEELRLSLIESEIRDGVQVTGLFAPARGTKYPLKPAGAERLAADIRAFLSGRREPFVSLTKPP